MNQSGLFPIFVKLANQPVLLIGGGAVALEKAESLVEAGANIHLISKEIYPDMQVFIDKHPKQFQIETRSVKQKDIDGVKLVFSATNEPKTNAQVMRWGEKKNLLVCGVDDSEHCHFYNSAVFDRGPLRIAISSQGKFAGFAASVKNMLNILLPDALDGDIMRLTYLRNELKKTLPSLEKRMAIMRKMIKKLEKKVFAKNKIERLSKKVIQ